MLCIVFCCFEWRKLLIENSWLQKQVCSFIVSTAASCLWFLAQFLAVPSRRSRAIYSTRAVSVTSWPRNYVWVSSEMFSQYRISSHILRCQSYVQMNGAQSYTGIQQFPCVTSESECMKMNSSNSDELELPIETCPQTCIEHALKLLLMSRSLPSSNVCWMFCPVNTVG